MELLEGGDLLFDGRPLGIVPEAVGELDFFAAADGVLRRAGATALRLAGRGGEAEAGTGA